MSEFNAKLFKAQLQTLLTHHGVGKMCHAPDGVVADFLDHCLQAFARSAQDRTLMQAMTAAPTEVLDPETAWMKQLLDQADDAAESSEAVPVPAAAPVGPTILKGGSPKLFELPVVADQATIDLMAIQIAAAPSPVLVRFLLDGEIQKEWELNQTLEIGDIKYKVIGVMPDGTLTLNRIVQKAMLSDAT